VEKLDLVENEQGKPLSHPFYRLSCPDFANVLALTENNEAVLVRQFRVGSETTTLEIPGGMIDPNEDPMVAAKRELEEETGYVSDHWQFLGSINPNPAIMNNTLHMFVAKQCHISPNRKHFPDKSEAITIHLENTENLEDLVKNRTIDSALAALTISWFKQFL
jgi:8-oxo-dGTP pyrophosphatase MutT (NUDIX family)